MSLSSISIKRPVLAIVMSLIIVVIGTIGLFTLPVREYPNVDPPIINVRTSYPGANAEIIETQITEILEASINGISGIRTLTSTSSDGNSNITVEFGIGVDMEAAANDVRDRVSRVQSRLPRDCDPPTVRKQDADGSPILMLSIRSDQRNLLDLSDVADRMFKEQLQTVPGISEINISGEKRYAIRVKFDPIKMSAYGLTAADVRSQISAENVELPSGMIRGTAMNLSIRTLGLLRTPQEFENLIIKEIDGNPIRLADIGRAEFSAENEEVITKYNGTPCVVLHVLPQSGANHIDISNRFRERLAELEKDIPEDIQTRIIMDTSDFVRRSLKEVEETVLIAFILVVGVIFAFLRNWRTTLIPMIAIPVSLVGTFAILYIFGFSINVMTLLAIVLAVGLVVDDAIVMMENIFVKIENGMTPLEAAFKGSKEVYFAIVSTTVVLVCVFLPVIFLSGLTGRLFREFAIAISGAVVISSFVSLTLSPMMCSKLLKPQKKKNWLYESTEKYFIAMTRAYAQCLNGFIRIRWIAIALVIGSFAAMAVLFGNLRQELAPLEDRSRITLRISVPEGTSYESMLKYLGEISDVVQETVPELKGIQEQVRSGPSITLFLVNPSQRSRTQQEIAHKLQIDLRALTKGRISVSQDPTIGDRRGGQSLQYVIQATSLEKLRSIIPTILEEANNDPTFSLVDVNLKFTKPELVVSIDREKANLLNVSTTSIAQTMQLAYAGTRIGYYTMNGKQYQIICEVDKTDRNMPSHLPALYVRNTSGEMIQLDNLVTDSVESNVPSLFRFNRYVSATVTANMAKGYTLGDGITAMDAIAKRTLDDTYKTDLSGQARELRESSGSIYFAFALALILVYLVLSAQFESFRDPFVIIMGTLPAAITGTLLALWFFDQTFNIFGQIGIIMLAGLVTKNGILIVEFANQRRDAGLSLIEAVKDASVSRLRPILMTSISTIFGILPIALAFGAGAESRVSMGIAVIGGMLLGTFISLFVVPAMYILITSKERIMIKEEDYV